MPVIQATLPETIDTPWLVQAFGSDGPVSARWDVQPIHDSAGRMSDLLRIGPLLGKLANVDESRVEIAFYSEVAPRTAIRVPGFHGAVVGSERALILLDWIDNERQQGGARATTTRRAEAMVDALAELHGRWWGRSVATLPDWHAPLELTRARVRANKECFIGLHARDISETLHRSRQHRNQCVSPRTSEARYS